MTCSLSVETLIPHRETMKLIDEITDISDDKAVSQSVVSERWPLYQEGGVDSLVLVEIVAQTAAAHVSWKGNFYRNERGGGLLAGIKNAAFHVDRIPEHTVLTATVVPLYSLDNYTVLEGMVLAGDREIARVELQVIHFGNDQAPDSNQ